MIFELETAIKAKLDTITRFSVVYDNHVVATSGFPYASFELASFDGEFLSVCKNKRNFIWNIVVVQDVNEKLERPAAKNIVYKILEDIITAFDGDQDLGEGTIVRGNVTKGEMGTLIEQEGTIIALNIELNLEITTIAG